MIESDFRPSQRKLKRIRLSKNQAASMKPKDILKALATKEDVVPTAALQAALGQLD